MEYIFITQDDSKYVKLHIDYDKDEFSVKLFLDGNSKILNSSDWLLYQDSTSPSILFNEFLRNGDWPDSKVV